MLWPVVPLFWIPVHGFSRIFKKLGTLTYIMPLITWPIVAYLIYNNRILLLQFKLDLHMILNITGIFFLLSGAMLHIWTGRLLGIWGLMGLPEISAKVRGRLVTELPFSIVRHPTYLAHTMMFLGVFLITGVAAVGVVTVIDFIAINILIIPLEDKELLTRFGEDYMTYKQKVPAFFPKCV